MGDGDLLCEDCHSPVHEQAGSLVVNPGRAFGPHGSNQVQPTFQLLPELARTRIFDASQLADQAESAEQRHAFLSSGREASVGKPHEQIERRWRRRERSGGLQVCRNRMGLNLSIELVAQNDPVLAISRQQLLVGIAGIPDASFRHETESRTMNDDRPLRLRVRAEKDGRAEDSLERGDQPPVLRTALLHSEGAQHLGCGFKHDLRRLLPDRLSRQEDRNLAIVSPRQSVARMADYLENELPLRRL